MALANAAWILAANGKRVLVADSGSRVPGLLRFFQPFMNPAVGNGPGIVDFIRRYEWTAKEEPVSRSLTSAPEGGGPSTREAIPGLTGDLVAQVGHHAVPVPWSITGRRRH